MKNKFIAYKMGAAIAAAVLTACAAKAPWQSVNRVSTAEEVGHVYVSAYPAVSWDDIADKLEPKFNLSTADARAMAVVTTQSQVSQVVSNFSAGLGLGLPSRTHTASSAVDNSGTVTTTSASQLQAGALPAQSGAVSTTPSADEIKADLTKAAPATGIDAQTQLINGTAIYQLAAILDNQISKGWKLRGYQANLITFQINLQPGRRNLGYDTYINLTLLPGEWSKSVATAGGVNENDSAFSPVIVYPLVISDVAENSSVAKSAEVMRQAALSLSGIVSNVGLNAGFNAANDKLDAIIASERNSLTSVGRISDNSLRIRIGAQLQGSKYPTMIPKTQNVSLVVFTRADVVKDRFLERLAVVSEVYFADVEQGTVLPAKTETRRLADTQLPVRALMRQHDIHFNKDGTCGSLTMAPTNVLRAVTRGDYEFLDACLAIGDPQTRGALAQYTPEEDQMLSTYADTLDAPHREYASLKQLRCRDEWIAYYKAIEPIPKRNEATLAEAKKLESKNKDPGKKYKAREVDDDEWMPSCTNPPLGLGFSNGLTPMMEGEMRMLFAEIMGLQADSRFSKLMVALPFRPRSASLPTTKQVVFLKDDGKSGTVQLRGGASLGKDQIKARLRIGEGTDARYLLPDILTVDSGKTINLSFPSLYGNKVLVKAKEPPDAPEPKGKGKATKVASTKVAQVPKVAAAPKGPDAIVPAVTLELTYDQVRSDIDLSGTYMLTILTEEEPKESNPLRISAAALITDRGGQAKLTIGVGAANTAGAYGLRVTGADIRSTEPKLVFNPDTNTYTLPAGSQVVVTLANLTPAKFVQLLGYVGKSAQGDPISLPVQMNAYSAPNWTPIPRQTGH